MSLALRERAKNRPSSQGVKNQLKITEFVRAGPMVPGDGPAYDYTIALQTRKKFVDFGWELIFFNFRLFPPVFPFDFF